MRLLDLAVEATQVGLPVDREALRAFSDSTREALIGAERKMREMLAQVVGKDRAEQWSPSNDHHVRWALFDPDGPFKLKPIAFSEKTRRASVAHDALRHYRDHEFVASVLEYRKHAKLLSTYVPEHTVEVDGIPHTFGSDLWRLHSDDRIRPIWNVGRTVTGRWTSNPNVQNWPKDLRAIIVAPPGRKLVGADYAQLELRIMAALSGDPELIRRCAEADESRKLEPDYDPHSYVASLVFGHTFCELPIDDPTHRKTRPGEPPCRCGRCRRATIRDVVKRVIYGLNYGAGAQRVLEAIYDSDYDGPQLSVGFIERVICEIFTAFPGIARWRDGQLRKAQQTREVRSPLSGRRRIFPLGQIEPPVVYNYPIQSGAADIINSRLLALVSRLASVDPSATFIAQVHDAVYFEVDETRAEDVARLVTGTLSVSLPLAPGAPEMPFIASAKVGRTWRDVS
jgi:DNA polymerase-1